METAGLFDNQREANFESTVAMVEDVLLELGHYINDCRYEIPGARRAWRIAKGSAQCLISLIDREDYTYMVASSNVVMISDGVNQLALFRKLLELNHDELSGIAFSLSWPFVRLTAERSTRDLDRSEVMEIVKRVQEGADEYDDILAEEFAVTISPGL